MECKGNVFSNCYEILDYWVGRHLQQFLLLITLLLCIKYHTVREYREHSSIAAHFLNHHTTSDGSTVVTQSSWICCWHFLTPDEMLIPPLLNPLKLSSGISSTQNVIVIPPWLSHLLKWKGVQDGNVLMRYMLYHLYPNVIFLHFEGWISNRTVLYSFVVVPWYQCVVGILSVKCPALSLMWSV